MSPKDEDKTLFNQREINAHLKYHVKMCKLVKNKLKIVDKCPVMQAGNNKGLRAARESQLVPAHPPLASSSYLSVVKKLSAWFSSLFNFSSPIGLQVLEVVDLLLAAHLCPARSEVFMCQ